MDSKMPNLLLKLKNLFHCDILNKKIGNNIRRLIILTFILKSFFWLYSIPTTIIHFSHCVLRNIVTFQSNSVFHSFNTGSLAFVKKNFLYVVPKAKSSLLRSRDLMVTSIVLRLQIRFFRETARIHHKIENKTTIIRTEYYCVNSTYRSSAE